MSAAWEDLGPDTRRLALGAFQAYLVRTSAGVVLVDTGGVGSGDLVTAALRDRGLDRDALTAVLLTHHHDDHAGSAAEIGGWPGVRVAVHHADADVVRGEVAGPDPVLTRAERGLWEQISAAGLTAAPAARVDDELSDGGTFAGARVLATPGHTAGSVAYHFPDQGVLCTGDIAAEQDGAVVLGPFNTDRTLARASFRRLGDVDADTVCFGHGRPLRGPDVALLHAAVGAATVPDPLGD